MSVALTQPWTIDEFLDWVVEQEGKFEFDGFAPVAMTGASANHSRISQNIYAALRHRLRGTPCSYFGPDLAIATAQTVRYPDAVVTCTAVDGSSLTAPEPVVVFEVLSPSSGGTDRIVKLREYQTIPSLLHYVIVESATAGLTSMRRTSGDAPWTAEPLTIEDSLVLDAIGVAIPVAEVYEAVDFAKPTARRGGHRRR